MKRTIKIAIKRKDIYDSKRHFKYVETCKKAGDKGFANESRRAIERLILRMMEVSKCDET